MSFSRMRQRDELRAGLVRFKATVVSESTSGYKNIGQDKVIYDNGPWTTKFVPGQYRNNPVDVRSFVGASNPSNWVLPPNIYTGWKELSVVGDASAYYATPPMSIDSGVLADSATADRLLCAAYAKMSTPDFDFGMVLAEIGSTWQLLHKPLKPLVRDLSEWWKKASDSPAVPATRRPLPPKGKPLKKPKGRLEDRLATGWLTWRYAICPGISDVNGILTKLLNPQVHKRGILERSKAGAGSNNTSKRATYEVMNFTAGIWHEDTYTNTLTSAGIYFHNIYQWVESSGGGVFDLPSLLYELIPLSFVLDWAYNFNDLLRAAQPKTDIAVLGTYVSHSDEVTFYRRPVEVWLNGVPRELGQFELRSPGFYQGVLAKYNRYVGPQIVAVKPAIYPQIFDINRSIDSVALAWNFLPKKLKQGLR